MKVVVTEVWVKHKIMNIRGVKTPRAAENKALEDYIPSAAPAKVGLNFSSWHATAVKESRNGHVLSTKRTRGKDR